MPQASKHAENAELEETEIDATGIKIRRKRRTRISFSVSSACSVGTPSGTIEEGWFFRPTLPAHDFLKSMLIPTRIMSTAKTFVSWSLLSFLTQPVAK